MTSNLGHHLSGEMLSSTMAFYKGLSYDNTYPSISKIANEFMTIKPLESLAKEKRLVRTANLQGSDQSILRKNTTWLRRPDSNRRPID